MTETEKQENKMNKTTQYNVKRYPANIQVFYGTEEENYGCLHVGTDGITICHLPSWQEIRQESNCSVAMAKNIRRDVRSAAGF